MCWPHMRTDHVQWIAHVSEIMFTTRRLATVIPAQLIKSMEHAVNISQSLLIFHPIFPIPSPCFPYLSPSIIQALSKNLSCLFLFTAAVSVSCPLQVNSRSTGSKTLRISQDRPFAWHTATMWGAYHANTTGMTSEKLTLKGSQCFMCLVQLILDDADMNRKGNIILSPNRKAYLLQCINNVK